MKPPFDPRIYWENRLSKKPDLAGVGWEKLGRYYNKWAYYAKKEIFARTVQTLALDIPNSSILDVGSGTGFYIQRWLDLGAKSITGCDIASGAVENLRHLFREANFYDADIGAPLENCGLAGKQFDIVSCFDVLYHIVDNGAFLKAIENISTLLKPGGMFFLTDYFMRFHRTNSKHVVTRTLAEYKEVLSINQLTVQKILPASVLCFPPSDLPTPLPAIIWYVLTSPVRLFSPFGYAYGVILAPLDILLTKLVNMGPGLKIMICQKRD